MPQVWRKKEGRKEGRKEERMKERNEVTIMQSQDIEQNLLSNCYVAGPGY